MHARSERHRERHSIAVSVRPILSTSTIHTFQTDPKLICPSPHYTNLKTHQTHTQTQILPHSAHVYHPIHEYHTRPNSPDRPRSPMLVTSLYEPKNQPNTDTKTDTLPPCSSLPSPQQAPHTPTLPRQAQICHARHATIQTKDASHIYTDTDKHIPPQLPGLPSRAPHTHPYTPERPSVSLRDQHLIHHRHKTSISPRVCRGLS